MHRITHARLLLDVLLASACLVLLAPLSVARAGSCPTCTASSECASSSGPGFCVVHDGPVGCGDLVTICCPGQGCAITGGGRPSCEVAGTCTVIEDIVPDAGMTDAGMTDAGTTDAGTTGTDTGTSDTDAGVGGTDSGTSGTDAGSGMDAGGTTPVEGGCSCRAIGPSDPSSALAWIGGAMALVIARRRR